MRGTQAEDRVGAAVGGPNGARPVHGASGSPWGLPRGRGSPQGSLGQRGRGQSREAQRGVQESRGRLRTCWVTEPTEEAPGGAKGCLAPRTWPLGGGSPPLGGWRQGPRRGAGGAKGSGQRPRVLALSRVLPRAPPCLSVPLQCRAVLGSPGHSPVRPALLPSGRSWLGSCERPPQPHSSAGWVARVSWAWCQAPRLSGSHGSHTQT